MAENSRASAAIIRSYPWVDTSLGPRHDWPVSLQATVDLMLPAKAQIVLFCGPEYVAMYNDAYAPTIGEKHPFALGKPAAQNWAELWDDLEPLLAHVRKTGETVSARDREFYIERFGFPETVYFDISYSPIWDDDGNVHSVFCIVSETTERVHALNAERRLAAIVSSSDDAILGTDLNQNITAWNHGAQVLYGYSADEMIGRPVTLLVPPDRPDEENAIMARILAGERVEPHETQRLCKDGSLKDVSLTVSPIRNEAGIIIGASKIARDISERKEAERLQRVLMAELKHRVKNILANVQAIARQTFRSSDAAASASFSARLRSLSSAHDLLTKESWEGADLAAVVSVVIDTFDPDRFSVTGPRLMLPPRAVVAISMALHELATNAVKYGALKTAEGQVSIAWQNDGEGGFQLIWTERGGPTVASPQHDGFGSLLIRDALAVELAGAVELQFEPDGVRCVVTAPALPKWDV